MKTLDLLKELRQHRRLALKRDVNIKQSRTSKIIYYFLFAFIIIYLMFFAIIFSMAINMDSGDGGVSSIEFMIGLSPFILTIDFFLRFFLQQTPSQIIKPYILLPIKRSDCINSFIITSLLSRGNLIWFALLLPYSLMSVVFSYGILETSYFLIYFWIIILTNSQWYLIMRTLITDSVLYWFLIAGIYATIFSPFFILGEKTFDYYSIAGSMIHEYNILPLAISLMLLTVLVFINQKIQISHVKKEISSHTVNRKHRIASFSFLDKYGELGLYMQLDLKSILRNKNPRKNLIYSTAFVIFMSLMITLTPIYDGPYIENFWCLYNLAIFGATMLTKIMGFEGNYIDGLMIRRENILSLIHAKYILYTAVLLLPFILMLPIVIIGKWPFFMLFSYTVFTAGFQYFVLFQLVVYNKNTIPLNNKFISKNGLNDNNFQIIASLICMLCPMIIITLMQLLFGNNIAYIITSAIGFAFILTHPIWLRNIYNRFMKRRYINMEAYRATRE